MNCEVRSIRNYVDEFPEHCKNRLSLIALTTGYLSSVGVPSIVRTSVIAIVVCCFVTESCFDLPSTYSSLLLSEARKRVRSIIFWDIALQCLKIGTFFSLAYWLSTTCSFSNCFSTPHHPDCPLWDALFFVPFTLWHPEFQVWISQSIVKVFPFI